MGIRFYKRMSHGPHRVKNDYVFIVLLIIIHYDIILCARRRKRV